LPLDRFFDLHNLLPYSASPAFHLKALATEGKQAFQPFARI